MLGPLGDADAVVVLEAAGDDEDEIDERPNTKAADGKEHEDGGSGFADVEAMCAEDSDDETKESGGQDALVGGWGHDGNGSDGGCRCDLLRGSAPWTDGSRFMNLLTAS